jgi:DNA-binding response OmpR family regulator
MSEKVNREQALKLGADDYIIKPFELDSFKDGELLDQVGNLTTSGIVVMVIKASGSWCGL